MLKRALFILVLPLCLWLCAPVGLFSQITVMGTLTRTIEAVPGEEYEGVISVKNTGEDTAQAKIYLRDYSFEAEGSAAYPEPGSIPRSNAPWIELSASTAVLAPGEIADLKYNLNIPGSDSLVGTYWSMIFVEGIPEEQEYAEGQEPTIAIRQVFRYGVQIVTNFSEGAGNGAGAKLEFRNKKIERNEKGRVFTIDLHNSGLLWLNGIVYMEVYSMGGDFMGTLEGGKFRTYPGTSVRKSFSLNELAPDTYKGLLIADGGKDNLFGGNYTLVISE